MQREEQFPGLSVASWVETQLILRPGGPGEDTNGL